MSQGPPPPDPQRPYGQPNEPPQWQQPPMGYRPPQPVPLSASDERLWATLAHVGVALTGFVGPLVIWLVLRERSSYVADQALEALNWSILVTVSVVVATVLTVVLIGAVLLPLIYLATIVFAVLGAVAANRGELYRYPVNWRIVK